MEHLDDDLNTLDELEEDAIEVKPELQRTENLANRSLRNSTVVDDDPDGKKQFRFVYLKVSKSQNTFFLETPLPPKRTRY